MPANLTTKLGQLVDVLTPDTTNTRIGVANASPTRTLDVTGTFGASGASTLGGTLTAAAANFSGAIGVGGNAPANANLRGWFAGAANKNIYIGYGGTNAIIQGLSDNLAAYAAIDIDASSLRLNSASAGVVGIGKTPSSLLDMEQTQNTTSKMHFTNASTGAAGIAEMRLTNSTSNAQMFLTSTGYTPAYNYRADALVIGSSGAGGVTLTTQAAQPIYFGINSVEKMRLDTSGNLLVGTTTSVGSLSNSAIMSAGRHQSFSGTATILNGGSTVTLTTLAAGGTYLVGWQLGEAAGVGVWISGGSNLGPQQAVISSGNYYTGTLTVGFTVAGFGYSPSTSTNCVFTCGNSTGGSATLDYVFTRLR